MASSAKVLFLFVFQSVTAGNHFPCAINYCLNGGHCTPMTSSPILPADILSIKTEELFSSRKQFLQWEDALIYCKKYQGNLLLPNTTADTFKLKRMFNDITKNLNFDTSCQKKTFWTGQQKLIDGKVFCISIKVDNCQINDDGANDIVLFPSSCDCVGNTCNDTERHQGRLALCTKVDQDNLQSAKQPNEIFSSKMSPQTRWIYSCQCQRGYGYENCSEVEENFYTAGQTFCQSNGNVVAFSLVDLQKMIVIDSVLYGRPLSLQSCHNDIYSTCPENLYAQSEDDICIARNALSAVTYWCQGKHSCIFDKEMLEDAAMFKEYFTVIMRTIEQEDNGHNEWSLEYQEASVACKRQGGVLAILTNATEAQTVFKLLMKQLKGSTKYFIDAMSHLEVSKNSDIGTIKCMFLQQFNDDQYNRNTTGHVLSLGACMLDKQHTQHGAICQAGFFQLDEAIVAGNSVANPLDSSCLKYISPQHKLIEYRYHQEDDLTSKEVSCPMHVDFRTGKTCYKKTAKMDWSEARRQCWIWGGDLAFPLPPNKCKFNNYNPNAEALWIASHTSCGHERCEIPFSSVLFVEGSYVIYKDQCFTNAQKDADCAISTCQVKRRGLCALAPTRHPRTLLPPGNEVLCPAVVATSESGWPYPGYSWNVIGTPGVESHQPCPKDYKGNSTWFCNAETGWIGYPDLSKCYKINISIPLDELNGGVSPPSDVIEKLFRDVEAEKRLGPGDVVNLIQVLDVALEVQNENLENAENPSSYVDKYTNVSGHLINDILKRPMAWSAIHFTKNSELTNLTDNVDNMAKSLIVFSQEHQLEYTYDALSIRVVKNVLSHQTFHKGESTIMVSPKSDNTRKSYSFSAYPTFACIFNNEFDCGQYLTFGPNTEDFEGKRQVVNSIVLGASVYEGSTNQEASSNVSVVIKFKHTLDGNQFNLTGPKCCHWHVTNHNWSTEGCLLSDHSAEYTTCICEHLTNFAVIMDINGNLDGDTDPILISLLSWTTVVGCSISVITLIICIYIFVAVRGLQGDRTTIHLNLCFCLLLGEVLLLTGLDAVWNPVLCSVIAGFLHFLFLSAFSWMLVEGIHVYYMLVKVFDRGHSMLWMSFGVGYGIPAGIVLVSVLVTQLSGRQGYGTDSHCWLDIDNGLIWAFAGPVLVVLFINLISFLQAINIAKRSLKNRTKQNAKDSNTFTTNMTLLKGSFSLMCILGLTWVLGFTYFASGSEWLSVPFALLNSLQGCFIFVCHILWNEKAKQEVIRHCRRVFKTLKVKIFIQTRNPQTAELSCTTSHQTTTSSHATVNGNSGIHKSTSSYTIKTNSSSVPNGSSDATSKPTNLEDIMNNEMIQ